MADTAMINGESADAEGRDAQTLEELEGRVQRLEDIVATLCDTNALEERVKVRLVDELRSQSPPVPVVRRAPVTMLDFDISNPAISGLTPVDERLLPGDAAPPEPAAAPATDPSAPPPRLSFLGEVWNDLSTFFRMVRDSRFRMSWTATFIPLFLLIYVIWPTSMKSWPFDVIPGSIPILGQLDELFAAYLGFKILGRESRRYRDSLTT